jgi:hypothetical protein
MTPRRLGDARTRITTPFALGRLAGVPTVTYHALEGGWWLWWPCATCGGVGLPLCGWPDELGPVCDQACPGCETHHRRIEPAGPDPTVWYDTWLEDWVVRVPCGGGREAALMPMEIRWFNAEWSDVILRAADIAFGSESAA